MRGRHCQRSLALGRSARDSMRLIQASPSGGASASSAVALVRARGRASAPASVSDRYQQGDDRNGLTSDEIGSRGVAIEIKSERCARTWVRGSPSFRPIFNVCQNRVTRCLLKKCWTWKTVAHASEIRAAAARVGGACQIWRQRAWCVASNHGFDSVPTPQWGSLKWHAPTGSVVQGIRRRVGGRCAGHRFD